MSDQEDEVKKLDHKIDYLELIESKDAEIARLKNIITATEVERATLRAANETFEVGMHWRNALITELCDALEWWATQRDYQPEFAANLIQRAREAAK